MRHATLALCLTLTGCTPAAWQTGLDTAGTIVDTAAVVRARRLGMCGDAAPAVRTEADAAETQAEIALLRTALDEALRRLTEMRVEMARRSSLPAPDVPPVAPSQP